MIAPRANLPSTFDTRKTNGFVRHGGAVTPGACHRIGKRRLDSTNWFSDMAHELTAGRLFETALELFASRGYAVVTPADVAEATGCSGRCL